MPRRIENTIAPRNPVARALANRGGGGVHQQKRTRERRQGRIGAQNNLDNWREDLEFERSLVNDNQPNKTKGSRNEPSAPSF